MTRLPAVLATALLASGLSAGAAHAATVSVSGKLPGAKGYTVLAVSPDGSAVRAPVRRGAFRLRLARARGATLQLVRPSGGYFGPIVLADGGKRRTVHLALSGKAAKLGRITLRRSWAQSGPRVPAAAILRSRTARADKRGKPAGAGSLGLEPRRGRRSLLATAAQAGAAAAGGADTDGDGLPNTVDVDDNANGVLDSSDPRAGGSDGLFTTIGLPLERSLNVNAGGVTAADVEAIGREDLRINFYLDHRQFGGAVRAIDVNCFALVYCRSGDGPAIMDGMVESPADLPRMTPWVDYDRNGNGLPDVPELVGGDVSAISIQPRVATSQVNAGDLLDLVAHTSRGTVDRPVAVPPYFVTTPAIASYDAGAGTQRISYPVTGGPGAQGTPIQLTGDTLALSFWRPQREAIAGAEPGSFVDMGNLHYGIPLEAGGRQVPCDGHYSDLSPTLRETGSGSDDYADRLFPLTDTAGDAAPDADRLLSFTLDLGACLRASGIEPAGQSLQLGLTAGAESRPGGNDRALQTFNVCLPGCRGAGPTGPGIPIDGTGPVSPPPADLQLTSLAAADEGADCRVTVGVKNAGSGTPGATEVAITGARGGSTYSATAPVGGLAAGAEVPVSAVLSGTSCAGLMVEARADHTNQLPESDENNNFRSQAF